MAPHWLQSTLAVCLLLAWLGASAEALGCPFAGGLAHNYAAQRAYLDDFKQSQVSALDFSAVKADIKTLLTDSKPFWPADFGNYGPLMIRLAWHCAGSYRASDGRGGCDGGHIRFDPERSWDDNTNLDKARRLLWPIKQKYGQALSWGDLIVLTGDTAIESMGGPTIGFCGGRVDSLDGSASLPLGPSPEQEALAPCPVNGNCSLPLGTGTVGLIYVNPEGPMGVPDPKQSAKNIREIFGRMGWSDSETVALIGGGHAFGKFHGACKTGPGPNPQQSPSNPWPGTCGRGAVKGKGNNTFTSGFEGSWVENPTKWSNDYFKNLLEYGWELIIGPGGKHQWKPTRIPGVTPPEDKLPDIRMLTSDVALLNDAKYLQLVKMHARDLGKLNSVFSKAWYKLMTRDMGPATRCLGKLVPPPQPFQCPLPPPAKPQPDFGCVREDIVKALTASSTALAPDSVGDKPYYGALFTTLAWQCASTFRATDYTGGCNGARIRFKPAKSWTSNKGMDLVLNVLEPVKAKYPTLSYADLIVLAGTVALEEASGHSIAFCGARSDAIDGCGQTELARRKYSDPIIAIKDSADVMGLTLHEAVALAGRLRSPSQQRRLDYSGSWSASPGRLSNKYFKLLLSKTWVRSKSAAGKIEYKAVGSAVYMLPTDVALTWDAPTLDIVQAFAADNNLFLDTFASAWAKLMNADRFKGPAGSICA